jgi:hypothetical protein
MGVIAIAIPIKVATTPVARFTIYPFALRPGTFVGLPVSARYTAFRLSASTAATMFLGKYS